MTSLSFVYPGRVGVGIQVDCMDVQCIERVPNSWDARFSMVAVLFYLSYKMPEVEMGRLLTAGKRTNLYTTSTY